MVKFGDDIAVDKNSVHLSCNVTDDLPGNIWRKEMYTEVQTYFGMQGMGGRGWEGTVGIFEQIL